MAEQVENKFFLSAKLKMMLSPISFPKDECDLAENEVRIPIFHSRIGSNTGRRRRGSDIIGYNFLHTFDFYWGSDGQIFSSASTNVDVNFEVNDESFIPFLAMNHNTKYGCVMSYG